MKKSRIRVIVASFLATICAIGGVALGNYDGVAEQETKTSADFFSATKNAEIITDYQAPEHIGDYKGIFVKSTDSGATTVTLNHAIDLRAFTSEDILLTMLPVTTEPISKTTDLQLTSITVRLTDASDENVLSLIHI